MHYHNQLLISKKIYIGKEILPCLL
jgi:hypothetical protein